MVHENGRWQQQRWVQNVYEYQRNTQISFSGDVSVRGKPGDLAGLTVAPAHRLRVETHRPERDSVVVGKEYDHDLLPSRWLRRAVYVSGRCSGWWTERSPRDTADRDETAVTGRKLLIAGGLVVAVVVAVCIVLVISKRPSDCETVRSMIAHNNQFNERVEAATSSGAEPDISEYRDWASQLGHLAGQVQDPALGDRASTLAKLAEEAVGSR